MGARTSTFKNQQPKHCNERSAYCRSVFMIPLQMGGEPWLVQNSTRFGGGTCAYHRRSMILLRGNVLVHRTCCGITTRHQRWGSGPRRHRKHRAKASLVTPGAGRKMLRWYLEIAEVSYLHLRLQPDHSRNDCVPCPDLQVSGCLTGWVLVGSLRVRVCSDCCGREVCRWLRLHSPAKHWWHIAHRHPVP